MKAACGVTLTRCWMDAWEPLVAVATSVTRYEPGELHVTCGEAAEDALGLPCWNVHCTRCRGPILVSMNATGDCTTGLAGEAANEGFTCRGALPTVIVCCADRRDPSGRTMVRMTW